MIAPRSLSCTIVITTKNRKDDLRRAISSCVLQVYPVEVLVVDDASSDGTYEMVTTEFPSVRIFRSTDSRGYIVQRNLAATLALGDILISIDDDAEFSTPLVIAQALDLFSDPSIGAVAIPYIEPAKKNVVLQRAPDPDGIWIIDRFIGTAHALRRELFNRLGGYREELIHQGEEADYCIRLQEAGYHVVLGRGDLIIHHESPKRDLSRIDFHARRNDILFAWQNVPFPAAAWRLIMVFLGGAVYGVRCGRPAIMFRGLLAGIGSMATLPRKPVSRSTFRLHRSLRKSGPRRMELPPTHLSLS